MGMLKINSGGVWKDVVPSSDPGFVRRGGDTMTGALLLPSGDPPEDAAAARKKYVDDLTRGFSAEPATTDFNNMTRPGVHSRLPAGNNPNGPGTGTSQYYYLTNHVYGYAADDPLPEGHTNNLTQVLIPYNNAQTFSICHRDRYSGTWTAWSSPYSYISAVFPFATGWGAHASYACYVERSRNVVCMRGLAQPDADTSIGTSTIGTLAAVYRPPGAILVPVIGSTNGSLFRSPDRLNINTAGTVSIQAVGTAYTMTSAGWCSLVSSWVVA
jgi:hypothetical protein